MSNWLILIVTIIYYTSGIMEFRLGHYGMAVVWVSYATANVGLMFAGGGFK